ncbi:hypothetical protein JW926_12375 [Candidatus Sumerlaeota bacterium]|nr:hypothetical protein [Candidatus Sumerlaeota bacterium]
MPPIIKELKRLGHWLIILAGLVVLSLVAYAMFYSGKTIHDLLGENKALQKSIANLTREEEVGYAKVISQEEKDGKPYTRILFVVTDPEDMTRRILEKEFEVEGDVVFFDALIVKFKNKTVMEGKDRALFLWRRVYSDKMKPEDGFSIDASGEEPVRYSRICSTLSVKNRLMFWTEIWNLSDDPERLNDSGVRAVYGNAVYKKVKPGLIYRFKLDASGAFYPDTVPDL